MPKLIDALQRAGKSAAVGFGFNKGTGAASKSKATAIIVSAKTALEAQRMIQAGADVVIVTPEVAAQGFKSEVSWGVDLRGAEKVDVAQLRGAQEGGADFVILSTNAPARALATKVEKLERVIDVIPPTDDPLLLKFRALNLLDADGAIFETRFTAQDLATLRVEQFAQLRALREVLRFPAILTLREMPSEEDLPLLVKLGAQGVWLVDATEEQVNTLREALERVPREHEEDSPSVGPMVASSPVAEHSE